jgi:ribosomal protein S18 acetylase RimI-like enzyme
MIEIRDARFSDHTAIARLHSANWRQSYRGILSDFYLDEVVEQNHFQDWKRQLGSPASNQLVLIAAMDQAVIGFARYLFDDDPEFGTLLENLHVSKDLQRNGVGRSLMREGARRIIERADKRSMYLWVFELNALARKAYHCQGGLHVGTFERTAPDGNLARSCRYFWEDVSTLL